MLRAAAKNHDFLTVLCDPADYPEFITSLQQNGSCNFALRSGWPPRHLPAPPPMTALFLDGWPAVLATHNPT